MDFIIKWACPSFGLWLSSYTLFYKYKLMYVVPLSLLNTALYYTVIAFIFTYLKLNWYHWYINCQFAFCIYALTTFLAAFLKKKIMIWNKSMKHNYHHWFIQLIPEFCTPLKTTTVPISASIWLSNQKLPAINNVTDPFTQNIPPHLPILSFFCEKKVDLDVFFVGLYPSV